MLTKNQSKLLKFLSVNDISKICIFDLNATEWTLGFKLSINLHRFENDIKTLIRNRFGDQ